MRNTRWRTASVAVSVLSLLALGMAPNPGTHADQVQKPANAGPLAAADGETIFRGVFFGTGILAEAMPELRQPDRGLDEPAAARLRASQDDVVRRVAHGDPAFFRRFAAAMHSGREIVVEQALRDAAQRFTSTAPEPSVSTTGQGLCLLLLAYRYALVGDAVAIVHDIAFWSSESVQAEGRLAAEELVTHLTARLALVAV